VLINGILDLTKIEAGKLELLLEYIDSYFFFSEFEKFFSLRLSEKGLKFIVELSPELPSGINVDEVRLHQIIINLIGNAIKFTEKGSIRLIVRTENRQIHNYSKEQKEDFIDLIIEVSDTGIGISKELQEEIFNPFVQGQGQDVKKYGGTGLGLAITKRLVQLMSGTISLESRLNRGSTFKIKIPGVAYLNEFEKAESVDELNPAGIIFQEAVILIVDDVEHNRHYLRDALKNTKLKIVEAKDGIEALSVAKKIVPDLIISDIRIPFLDGFQLLSKLKSDTALKHIPVIAYSASVMKDQKDHIRESEFAGLLIKPVSVAELYTELMKNLRFTFRDLPEPRVAETGLEEMNTVTDPGGLVQSLDEKQKTIYPTFRIIQPIDEVMEFGNQLIHLGKTHTCSIVTRYGEELVNAAERFNIEEILIRIKKYPDLVERLRQLN
jgi:two-component system sensor histidine kinase EvgS